MNPIANLQSFVFAFMLLTIQVIAQETPGIPVDTAGAIKNNASLDYPNFVEPLVNAIAPGHVTGIADDGTLIGRGLDGKRYVVPYAYSLSYKYSLKEIDGKVVLWMEITWDLLAIQDSASSPVDYIDLGLTEVQLVDALLDEKIDMKVFDAIAYAAQIRRNDPNRRQFLLNLLALRSAARGNAPRVVNRTTNTYMLTLYQTVYNGFINDGIFWITGAARVPINIIINGYKPVLGPSERMVD